MKQLIQWPERWLYAIKSLEPYLLTYFKFFLMKKEQTAHFHEADLELYLHIARLAMENQIFKFILNDEEEEFLDEALNHFIKDKGGNQAILSFENIYEVMDEGKDILKKSHSFSTKKSTIKDRESFGCLSDDIDEC